MHRNNYIGIDPLNPLPKCLFLKQSSCIINDYLTGMRVGEIVEELPFFWMRGEDFIGFSDRVDGIGP